MTGDNGVSDWLRAQGHPTRRPASTSKNHAACPFPIVTVRVLIARPFYEAAVLFDSLNKVYWESVLSREYEPKQSNITSKEVSSRDFINKLCQFCDNEPHGTTVTACALLDNDDHVEYRFASNQINDGQREMAVEFIEEILETLQKARRGRLDLIRSKLLQKVIRFCRRKIQVYITALVGQLASFMVSESLNESLLYELEELQSIAIDADDRKLDHDSFLGKCEKLMKHLDVLLSKDDIISFVIDKAKQASKPRPQNYWAGFRHSSGRLVSYLRATKTLTIAQLSWPGLSKRSVVRFLPSSRPDPNPFIGVVGDADRGATVSAESIIGKMTGDMRLRKQYQGGAQELQKRGLDTTILARVKAMSFKPLVHAEIIVSQSLEREGLRSPTYFFKKDAYIGASKPTCQLCHWYFERQSSEFHVRPTHNNFYPAWKLPDICQCEEGLRGLIESREGEMVRIKDLMRQEALRVIQEKAPKGKVHDSTTDPTFPLPSLGGDEPVDVEDSFPVELTHDAVVLPERERRPYG